MVLCVTGSVVFFNDIHVTCVTLIGDFVCRYFVSAHNYAFNDLSSIMILLVRAYDGSEYAYMFHLAGGTVIPYTFQLQFRASSRLLLLSFIMLIL